MTASPPVEPAPGEPSGAAALYEELRSRIVHLDIAPGTRLTEQALASSYGMSRTPTRRVLDRLAHEGLISISPGSGATVSAIDYRQLREVWALRLKIAEMVGYFVQLPASPDLLQRLQQILERLDEVESSTELPYLYDEYHSAMLEVMSNGPLRQIYDQLYAQAARMFVQLLPSLDLATEIDAIRDEVQASLEACQERSGHRLAKVRTEHMRMLLTRINEVLTIDSFGGPAPGEEEQP